MSNTQTARSRNQSISRQEQSRAITVGRDSDRIDRVASLIKTYKYRNSLGETPALSPPNNIAEVLLESRSITPVIIPNPQIFNGTPRHPMDSLVLDQAEGKQDVFESSNLAGLKNSKLNPNSVISDYAPSLDLKSPVVNISDRQPLLQSSSQGTNTKALELEVTAPKIIDDTQLLSKLDLHHVNLNGLNLSESDTPEFVSSKPRKSISVVQDTSSHQTAENLPLIVPAAEIISQKANDHKISPKFIPVLIDDHHAMVSDMEDNHTNTKDSFDNTITSDESGPRRSKRVSLVSGIKSLFSKSIEALKGNTCNISVPLISKAKLQSNPSPPIFVPVIYPKSAPNLTDSRTSIGGLDFNEPLKGTSRSKSTSSLQINSNHEVNKDISTWKRKESSQDDFEKFKGTSATISADFNPIDIPVSNMGSWGDLLNFKASDFNSSTAINSEETSKVNISSKNKYLDEDPKVLALNLFQKTHPGITPEMTSPFLGANTNFHLLVRTFYMQNFSFNQMSLDDAFRCICDNLKLGGETQCVDRILLAFATRFYECNPELTHLYKCVGKNNF